MQALLSCRPVNLKSTGGRDNLQYKHGFFYYFYKSSYLF
jgi:hypothetical protein